MTTKLHSTEKELNGALCSFCNSASDPYPPASEWDDEVYRCLNRLSMAYNEWYKWMKSTERDPFGDAPLSNGERGSGAT